MESRWILDNNRMRRQELAWIHRQGHSWLPIDVRKAFPGEDLWCFWGENWELKAWSPWCQTLHPAWLRAGWTSGLQKFLSAPLPTEPWCRCQGIVISTAGTLFQTMSPEIPPQPSLAVSSSYLGLGSRKPFPLQERQLGGSSTLQPAWLCIPRSCSIPSSPCHTQMSKLEPLTPWEVAQKVLIQRPLLACSHRNLPWISPRGKQLWERPGWEVLLDPKVH